MHHQKIQSGKVYRSLKQECSESDEEDLFRNDNNRIVQGDNAVHFKNRKTAFEAFSPFESNESFNLDDNIEFFRGKAKETSMLKIYLIVFIFIIIIILTFVFIFIIQYPKDNKQSIIWTKTFEKIELIRPLIYVPAKTQLIFTYQNSKWDNIRDSGIVAIEQNNSNHSWQYRFLQNQLPQNVNCSLTDFNSDNQTDCVIFHENGLLKIINSIDGNQLWSLISHIPFFIKKISYPVVVKDINDDQINDLLVVINYNQICLIDGQNGELILDPIEIKDCNMVTDLKMLPNKYFEYICDQKSEPKRIGYYHFWRLDSELKEINPVFDDHLSSNSNHVIDFAMFSYNTF